MTAQELQAAFQSRIEQHKKILYKVCHAYCRDRDSREDLAQEITLQLWRAFPKFDGRCQFSTWMYRIALNVAISWVRSTGRRQRLTVPLDAEQHDVASPSDPAADERVRALYQVIHALDPLSRALLLLYLDEHSYRDIAAILAISHRTVHKHLQSAYTKLGVETRTAAVMRLVARYAILPMCSPPASAYNHAA